MDTGGTQQCMRGEGRGKKKEKKQKRNTLKNKLQRGEEGVPRGPAEFGDSERLSLLSS